MCGRYPMLTLYSPARPQLWNNGSNQCDHFVTLSYTGLTEPVDSVNNCIVISLQNRLIASKPHSMRMNEFQSRQQACAFIQNFAENHALVLPGRMTNYKNPDLKLLPSSMTKKYVYGLYTDSLKDSSTEPLSLRLWYETWIELCGNVVVQLPCTDLCSLCQQNQMTVGKMINLDKDKKLQLIQKCQDHLLTVQKERKNYSEIILQCKTQNYLVSTQNVRLRVQCIKVLTLLSKTTCLTIRSKLDQYTF